MVMYDEIREQLYEYQLKLSKRASELQSEREVWKMTDFGWKYVGVTNVTPSGLEDEIKFLRQEQRLWKRWSESS